MAETPRIGEGIIDSEEAPIELGDADILSAEPLNHSGGANEANPTPLAEGLRSIGVDPEQLLETVRKKLAGVESIDKEAVDDSVIDGLDGQARVQGPNPDGTITPRTVADIEKRATGVIFKKARDARNALKTPDQRDATERAIQQLRRLSGQPPLGQASTDQIPQRPQPNLPQSPSEMPSSTGRRLRRHRGSQDRKDKLIRALTQPSRG